MPRPRPTCPDSVLAALLDTACHCGSTEDLERCEHAACFASSCPDHRRVCSVCSRVVCLKHAESEGWAQNLSGEWFCSAGGREE